MPRRRLSSPARLYYRSRMNAFERRLSLWVAACMVVGILIGKSFPDAVARLREMQFGAGSQINIPIALLIWLMIYPMMLRIDFASIRRAGSRPAGLAVTLVINWLVKPFTMALLAWVFLRYLYAPFVAPALASEYIAGLIILAAVFYTH